PAGFEGVGELGARVDVTIPLAWEPQTSGPQTMMRGAGIWWFALMGRLQPGATREQAQASLTNAFQQSVAEHRQALQARATTPLRPLQPQDYPRLSVDPGSQGEMVIRRSYQKPL